MNDDEGRYVGERRARRVGRAPMAHRLGDGGQGTRRFAVYRPEALRLPATPRQAVGPAVVVAIAAIALGWLASVIAGRPPGGAGSSPAAAITQTRAPTPSAFRSPPQSAPASVPPSAQPSASASPSASPAKPAAFSGGLLIADRQNGRLLIVDPAGKVLWHFPVAGSLPAGHAFAADDAFLSPDHKTIVANEESHQIVVRIEIATHRVIWQYGRYDVPGGGPGLLRTPDDAYPLANGNVLISDIRNCRVIEVSPAKRIVRQWGRTGLCRHQPPRTYSDPNGGTPLPDGGILITEITGSRVVRVDRAGRVIFDIHVPTTYPSDAQLTRRGDILVVDYAKPGAILRLNRRGKVLWRYGPRSGPGRLDHPSLAIELPNGLIAVNDDFRHRVLIIDPKTNRIVWQYGHTDVHGRARGFLYTPDGIDLIPQSVTAKL
jgi:outer membrane protein assembly factor BamB